MNMFNSFTGPRKELKDIHFICPVCKITTTVQISHHLQWRIDCLHCIETENVRAVITDWRREENDDKGFTDFHPLKTKMYVHLPDNSNMYVWTWEFNIKKTSLQIIDREYSQPMVHIFDELMDINLSNFIAKTKMCLIFG